MCLCLFGLLVNAARPSRAAFVSGWSAPGTHSNSGAKIVINEPPTLYAAKGSRRGAGWRVLAQTYEIYLKSYYPG